MQEPEYRIEPQDERPDQPAAWTQWDRAVRRPWWRRNIEWLIIAAAVVAIAAVIATNRTDHPATASTTATTATPAPAQMLADLDGDTIPVVQYATELGLLEPHCTQDQARIAALANAGYDDLASHGITGENRLAVLRNLAASLPAGFGPVDCASVLSAYLLLREG